MQEIVVRVEENCDCLSPATPDTEVEEPDSHASRGLSLTQENVLHWEDFLFKNHDNTLQSQHLNMFCDSSVNFNSLFCIFKLIGTSGINIRLIN